jgi:Uma2 family endonuclease
VIEVADSSLEYDRTTKQQMYAQAGIAVYWVVSIPDKRVGVFEHPDSDAGDYARQTPFGAGEVVRGI